MSRDSPISAVQIKLNELKVCLKTNVLQRIFKISPPSPKCYIMDHRMRLSLKQLLYVDVIKPETLILSQFNAF